MSWLEGLGGLALTAAILFDVFQAVVMPRPSPGTFRPSRYVIRGLWFAWRFAGLRIRQSASREGFLAAFGPLTVIVLLVTWVIGLVAGYGLLMYALRTELRPAPVDLWTAFYFAATSLLTIGFGDVVATQGLARVVSVVAGATGLGVMALVVTFLFTLYGSFQRREQAVVVLEAGAGAPPSGLTLLESYAKAGIRDDLARAFEKWQGWAAEILDSHLAYPVLAYFRSSHANDSWIGSLGAVMDAASLVLTTVEDGPKGWAKLLQAVGGHCLEDLVIYFRLPDEQLVGVERWEFEAARDRLARAGYRLRDPEESWREFSALRSRYAGRVNALARYWVSPPGQWIGDRSPLRAARPDGSHPVRPARRALSDRRR
jgi:hypothetical protein